MRGLLQRLLDARVDAVLSRRALLARAALALVPELGSLTLPARFPMRALPLGLMPVSPTSGVDAWDSVTTSLYSGANPFSGVKDPAGSGRTLLRNVNRLTEPEKHTTFGWPRDLPDGSTSYLAFEVEWASKADFTPKGWSLVAQLQAKNGLSPVWAISNDAKDGHWFATIRFGSTTLRIPMGSIVYGKIESFVVGCHLAASGFVEAWRGLDITKAPLVRRTGATTQGATGHHTLGIYAERKTSGAYVAHFGRAGRGHTAAEAVAQLALAA